MTTEPVLILGDWALPKPWTVPRAHALRVLAQCPNGARVSNETRYPTTAGAANPGAVYWQVAAWLQREGYATTQWRHGAQRITLTDAGRDLIARLPTP